MDSWASVIQLNLVFASDALAFSVFETTVSCVNARGNALLHGIAAACDVSNFLLAFLMMSLYSSSLGSIEYKFRSNLWRVRVSVSLFFERLFHFLSKRQATYYLDVMSFGFLSVSPRTTYILLEEFVQ